MIHESERRVGCLHLVANHIDVELRAGREGKEHRALVRNRGRRDRCVDARGGPDARAGLSAGVRGAERHDDVQGILAGFRDEVLDAEGSRVVRAGCVEADGDGHSVALRAEIGLLGAQSVQLVRVLGDLGLGRRAIRVSAEVGGTLSERARGEPRGVCGTS